MARQQGIFLQAVQVVGPGIDHLCQLAIIDTNPTIEDAGHDLKQEEDDDLGVGEAGAGEESYFSDEPGKENEVGSEQEIMHQSFRLIAHKINNLIHTDPYKNSPQLH